MSWKDFPPWKKTGVVFVSIFLALVIVDLVLFCKMGTCMSDPCGILLILASLPVFSFTQYFAPGYPAYFGTVFFGTIFYFGVGAGIGWLFSRLSPGV